MANLVKNNGEFSASAEKTIVMGHFEAIRRPPNEAAFVIWLTGALSQERSFPNQGTQLSGGPTNLRRLRGAPGHDLPLTKDPVTGSYMRIADI
jgi:hypothetical protein